ncbi:SusC/RagA family TonB-linked outer membrane protein [Belliella aquatica]|uniref:SusC/RagA family TonB-linked outer membrane protein n=1 Tax=Belliella aquatica TaxID=1323734 RepID=A0ABQ1M261_9BACT|nr:SusC/RagA family TonB-linked outer membrane protein [Belliella aquatica]MCH7407293.1 SusC/RagA family TonB-linked outer membrane protein [Belliella aquatica]GGC31509.1 SusC/RagA family TonB-linked outer membrane protein [Belliella aquatica]
MKRLLYLIVLLFTVGLSHARQSDHLVSGKVTLRPTKEAAIGASIVAKGTSIGSITDLDGEFSLRLSEGKHILIVSYIGYQTQEFEMNIPTDAASNLHFELFEDALGLSEVEVFSTGYQEIPKERATGSFVQVDNKLVNRRISTNILDRLEDITPGLIFNRDMSGTQNDFTIRGTSTLFSDARPLIIIDNFPHDGPLENINPNDVESITVLRDAAAASIWGAKAGNGVVVITTKKGKKGMPIKVSINANTTVVQPRDLFYEDFMSVDAFIDAEKMLFNRGQFADREGNMGNLTLSPVVETLIKQRDGLISAQQAENIIDGYRNTDLRRDLQRFFYRPEVRQQYSLGVSGGSEFHNYSISAGFDGIKQEIISNANNRVTLNAQNNFTLANNRLKINSGIYLTQGRRISETAVPSSNYLYEPLRDPNGNNLPIIRGVSRRFAENAQENGFLNWDYVPLDEIGATQDSFRQNDFRINTGISYTILPGLEAEVMHQYWSNSSGTEQLRKSESFFARDIINDYTTFASNGNPIRNIPNGGVRDYTDVFSQSHQFRAQLKYNGKIGDKGYISGLAGAEAKNLTTRGNSNRWYGYDSETGASLPVDYTTFFRNSSNNAFNNIPRVQNVSGTVTRFVSGYANLSYTHDNKYVLSLSARQDGSNIFGVNANQRLVPLWSTGLNWNLSEESFYKWDAVPFVRLRSTYGFNGNVNSSLSAFPTAFIRQASTIGNLPYLALNNPGNPDLRWERIGILNLALDFETKGGRLSGNIEYYSKNGIDLIGTIPFPSNSGITTFTGNFSSMVTRGWDLNLNSKNLRQDRNFKWNTNFFLSVNKEEVTDFEGLLNATSYFDYGTGGSGVGPRPRVGYPLHAVYTIPYAGLDPDTGNPRGFLDGEPSTNAGAVISSMEIDDLIFEGYGRPTVFGALRNDFAWKNFSVSANISYRMGYVFRRPTLSYFSLLNGWITHSDYERRWQNPGDEVITDVPSLPSSYDNNSATLYNNSEVLIERGDHIRLQDIRMSYTLQSPSKLKIDRLEVFLYLNNLGVLWKATDLPLDPDFRTVRPMRSMTFGVNLNL